MSKRRAFTEAEDKVILDSYHQVGAIAIAERLGRVPASVRSRAQYLGIARQYEGRKQNPTRTFVRRVNPSGGEKLLIAGPSAPVSPSLEKLARFDPILARAANERRLGLAPGSLIIKTLAGYE